MSVLPSLAPVARLRYVVFGVAFLLLLLLGGLHSELNLLATRKRDWRSSRDALWLESADARLLAATARKHAIPPKPYKAVLCSLMHNEAHYVDEWILYHYLIGFDHFILYDHASSDSTVNVIQPYIDAGLVEVVMLPSNATLLSIEASAHRECLTGEKIGHQDAEWMATFDLDEQLAIAFRPEPGVFRPSLLGRFLDHQRNSGNSVLVLSRYTHTTGNQNTRPQFPLTQADVFTERRIQPLSNYGPKPIGLLGHYTTPMTHWAHHWVDPIEPWKRVNPGGKEIASFDDPGSPSYEPIRLVHFISRSSEDCVEKSRDPGQAGTWRAKEADSFCAQFHSNTTGKDMWHIDDHSLRISPYNEAVRHIRSTGGLFAFTQ